MVGLSLIFGRLHLFWKTPFEVLLNLLVIIPESFIHHRVHLLLSLFKVALGDNNRIFTERQHSCFTADRFKVGTYKSLGHPGERGCKPVPLRI